MQLHCNNGSPGFHTHPSLEEAQLCWGTPALYVLGGDYPSPVPSGGTRPAWVPGGPPSPKPRWYDDPSSPSQHWRVEREGGSVKRAKGFTKGQCSQYIDALQIGKAPKELDPPEDDPTPVSAAPVSPAAPLPPAPPRRGNYVHGHRVSKTETFVMVPLLERVPDGRYAVQMDENDAPTFLRVVRPKNGQWKDCLKVQTQHAERYEEAWVKWSDGQIGVFKVSVEDYIDLLVCDYRGAARRYAKIKQRCARCNIELTDERSRHYGIGPECEKYWSWMITQVDEETALQSGS